MCGVVAVRETTQRPPVAPPMADRRGQPSFGLVLLHTLSPYGALASVINLNHPAHYVHWHFFQMSLANVVVIALMILVFVLAVALPFPGSRRRSES